VDIALFTTLNALPARLPVLGRIAVVIAEDGIVLYAVLLLWLWVRAARTADRRRLLLLAVFAAVLSLGVNAALNIAYPRPRPFSVLPAHVLVPRPHDVSFPSDHAAVTAAIGVALILGGGAAWGVAALIGAAVIGLARVAVGIHYPSDIAGGMAVGALCAAAVTAARRLLLPFADVLIALARRLRLG
jgi:undecaprenyl-diphosphatase